MQDLRQDRAQGLRIVRAAKSIHSEQKPWILHPELHTLNRMWFTLKRKPITLCL